jgi:F-type H+-transporting ATPase subunit delta
VIYRRIARRYAAALFGLTSRQRVVDEVERDLSAAQQHIAGNAALSAVLAHPEIPSQRKQEIIQAVFSGLQPAALSFVRLLVARRRHEYLGAVIEEYRRLADEARRLVRARATSAVPLTPEQKERLRRALEHHTGKTVELGFEVDRALLAGLLVQMDDHVIDASARGRLEKMRALLAGARFRGLGE